LAGSAPVADWKRRFFTVWASQAVSLVGSSVAGFALVWWLTVTTGSATVLMVSTLAYTLPQVLLGPLVGTFADRWNRRLVMMAADGAVALVSAWLAYLFWTGQAQPWHVFVMAAARSLGGTFHYSAFQASTSLMVPEAQLSRVAGLNQTIQAATGILAPPLGALLLTVSSVATIMLIDVGSAAIAVCLMALVSIPQPGRPGSTLAAARTSVWTEMVEGFRYVKRWRALAMLLGVSAILNLVISPPMYLLPLLVTSHFGGAADELAVVESAFSAGMVVGGAVLAAWGGFRRRMLTVLLGLLAGAAFLFAVFLAPANAFWLAVAALAGFGFTLPMINGPVMAIVQATVDPAIQGRVMTLIASLSGAAAPIGLVLSGPFADAFGVRPLYLIAAAVILVVGVGGFLVPELYRFEDSNQAARARPDSPAEVAPQ